MNVSSMYSWEKTTPACRRYFAYARSTTTWRQLSPARSTSWLSPSTSASPCQVARLVHQLQLRDVLRGLGRGVLVLVGLRVRVDVQREQPLLLVLAEVPVEDEPEVVVPQPGRVRQLLAERVGVDVAGRGGRVG